LQVLPGQQRAPLVPQGWQVLVAGAQTVPMLQVLPAQQG
jgi:hypothetical protein